MKTISTIAMAGTLALVAGCTTSSQVQEMIDAANRDSSDKSAAHEASIDVLRKSSMAALEKGLGNAEAVAALQRQMQETTVALETVKRYAEAAKLMSAANTVKVADLVDAMVANKEDLDESIAQLRADDTVFKEVMTRHYKMMAENAEAAIETLRAEGGDAENGEPIAMGEPIEIVAPDTTATTDASAR